MQTRRSFLKSSAGALAIGAIVPVQVREAAAAPKVIDEFIDKDASSMAESIKGGEPLAHVIRNDVVGGYVRKHHVQILM